MATALHTRPSRYGTGKRAAAVLVASALTFAGVVAGPTAANAADENGDYTISGSVTDSAGSPVSYAGLTLYGQDFSSQEAYAQVVDGAYSFTINEEVVLAGDYIVEVRASGYLAGDQPVTLTGNDLVVPTIVLADSPRYSVSGTVTADADISGLRANLYRILGDGESELISSGDVDAAGNYSLSGGIDEYLYRVTISDPQGAFATTTYRDAAFAAAYGEEFANGIAFYEGATGGSANQTGKNITLATSSFANGGVSVSGGTAVGNVLVASAGFTPAASSFTYQWARNGVAIGGATGAGYAVTAADQGASLTVAATATKRAFKKSTATSGAVAIPVAAPVTVATVVKAITKVTLPKVSGTLKVGKTIKAAKVSWKPASIKLSYKWYANGKVIKKATKSSLKLTKALAGKTIKVKITGKKAGYKTLAKVSKSTSKIKK